MCGIFGIAVRTDNGMSRLQWDGALRDLFLLSESRGKEAAGIAIATDERIVVHKDSTAASEMLRTRDFKRAVERGLNGHFNGASRAGGHASNGHQAAVESNGATTVAAIGHCRLVTNGLQGIDANNQPVCRDDAVVIHNGIVVNVDELWAKQNDIKPTADVDTEVIAALIEKYRKSGATPIEAVAKTFGDIFGETSIALLFRDLRLLILATNTGSLYLCDRGKTHGLFFASEDHVCRQLTHGSRTITGFDGVKARQIRPNTGVAIDLDTLEVTPFSFGEKLALPAVNPGLANGRALEDKARRLETLRKGLRRCTRCILPETMPYITFDGQGVCNYCHTYQPWTIKPESEVEAYLDRFRSQDGSTDCVMAFSGGRDSSYGLHLLKTKYRMTPVCFSYDWGMVTDLARRNQARMCGKLGVEHIWISADIRQKRDNIRRNVLAWLKKPDLGMIPLFMAGDKQFFWYANSLIKSTGVDLTVFCTNRLEKTDFKLGFIGVPPKDSEMRTKPSTLAALDKANLFYQYGSRFLSNPHYLNRSLADTAWAAFSYYGIKQDHLFLFDYLKWDEDEINATLIGEYDWEKAKDTDTTWRIGDGTAPFYNYIYYTVAGFTEFDTFRSNQIREGQLTRDKALAMVEVENRPRWSSIREYTQLINVNFDDVIRIIDRIPKLYVKD